MLDKCRNIIFITKMQKVTIFQCLQETFKRLLILVRALHLWWIEKQSISGAELSNCERMTCSRSLHSTCLRGWGTAHTLMLTDEELRPFVFCSSLDFVMIIVGDCDCSDVNGVIVCVKVGKVPVETQQFQHATPTSTNNEPLNSYMQR